MHTATDTPISSPSPRSKRVWPLWAALAVLALLVPACMSERSRAAELPMIAAINDAPNLYEGGTVLLHGEVDEVVGPRAFVMESDGNVFDAEILVLVPDGMSPAVLEEDQALSVHGTVRRVYSGVDFATEHDLDLGEMTYVITPGAPVVVVDRLDL